jgi:hypothetical protein
MKKLATVIIIFGILIAATIYDANPILESATMLLLGVGLIGLAGIGRRSFFGNNR